MKNASMPRQLGFVLVEVMIAGLIMAFGMLALLGMQMTLSRNADVARARSEATRLAQEKMEELRAFTVIAPTVATDTWATTRAWNNMLTGTDSVTTNSAFSRSWTLGSGNVTTPDVMKTLTVTVGWTDRAGVAQTVTLNSIVSRTDPSDSGFLGFPLPQNTNLKRPMNRNINIPIPAIDLGNGRSGYQITSKLAVVFSNDSGVVIQKCSSAQDFTISKTYDFSTCTTSTALMVAGYVSRTSTSIPWPTGINYGSIVSADNSSINCKFGDALDQTTNTVLSNYKYYLCIVPIGAANSTNPPPTWSGKILLGGIPASSGSNNYVVCRYQYISTTASSNARNVQPYVSVSESLDSQNYIIGSGNNYSCPAGDSTVTPTLHQDCRANNQNRATDCPATSANGAV